MMLAAGRRKVGYPSHARSWRRTGDERRESSKREHERRYHYGKEGRREGGELCWQ